MGGAFHCPGHRTKRVLHQWIPSFRVWPGLTVFVSPSEKWGWSSCLCLFTWVFRSKNFFKYILLIMLLQLSHFFLPFIPLHLVPCLPPSFPHLSSCPWVIHISSLASPFPILFLTSPCLFCTYHLCYLFPVLFPPLFPLPTDNPPRGLHFCDSAPVPVCLVHFWFCFCFFSLFVDSCDFVVILLFVFLIIFFLDKSL